MKNAPRDHPAAPTRCPECGAPVPAGGQCREGEPPPQWVRGAWPMHVADVLAGGVERYPELVTSWARSVCATIDDR